MWGVALSQGARIFAHGHVQNPMKPVLYPLVRTRRGGQFGRLQDAGTDVIAPRQFRFFAVDDAQRVNAPDRNAPRRASRINNSLRGEDRRTLASDLSVRFVHLRLPINPGPAMAVDGGRLDRLAQTRLASTATRAIAKISQKSCNAPLLGRRGSSSVLRRSI